ncbi:PREDICTED: SPRY domain-containing SOCS box protein 3 [Nicrophorus vespilloides]|uniref:SPRY domain-containing SOCS box protein 3 n=1 Tax=Nicrophorus vespilloides TaxID=110193 RepID=A0ABM1N0Q6_NICVS|nr:PREDICTED: SPRY domain-containing SOCS box protein 3 [Nicrophorus vespilloides]
MVFTRRVMSVTTDSRTKEINLRNADSLCCSKCCGESMYAGKLCCDCGEGNGTLDWLWDESCEGSDCVIAKQNKCEVLFHPVYSSGTAIIRGDQVFEKNFHYYFEVKILTTLYGTDVMVGVVTPDVNFKKYQLKFCSMLGHDDKSWGYSYSGHLHYYGLTRKYSKQFGLGSLVGMYVDMCRGTIEYYLNRKPLGIAFNGLKEHKLIPTVCSTAAQSAVRLTCAKKLKPSLQLTALNKISRNTELTNSFFEVPGLSMLCQKDFFWLTPRKDYIEQTEQLTLEDEVVLSLDSEGKRKKVKVDKWGIYIGPSHAKKRIKRRKSCKCVVIESGGSKQVMTQAEFLDEAKTKEHSLLHFLQHQLSREAEETINLYSDDDNDPIFGFNYLFDERRRRRRLVDEDSSSSD